MTQSRSALRDLLTYVIDSTWETGVAPTRTRIQKLVFLLDLGYADTHSGQTWSGFDWRFHHYGPYAAELQASLDSLDGIYADDHEGRGTKGTFHVYRGAHGARDSVDLDRILDTSGRTVLRKVLQQWAAADLNRLLDYVYFETRPMAHARRGDKLNFETATSELFVKRTVRNPHISAEALERLRASLRSQDQGRAGGIPMDTLTKPLGAREEKLLERAEGLPYATVSGYVDLPIGRQD
jgi:hypothetical protein